MTNSKYASIVKPTLKTLFHIDFEWWRKHDRNWRVYLRSNLCSQHQESFAELNADEEVDWVDPETAEVQLVDGLQHVLITHCAQREGFIAERSALVDAVFRLFLANGNTPMTFIEIGERLQRPPATILRTLSGVRVYKGLRPCME